jgi:hypothetical protein
MLITWNAKASLEDYQKVTVAANSSTNATGINWAYISE